jgi:hypothetical protein
MAKYEPLRAELLRRPAAVTMTFSEVAELYGELPPSAYEHRPWWLDRSTDTTMSRPTRGAPWGGP